MGQLHAQIAALMGTIQSQMQEFSQRLASVEQRNIPQPAPIVNHEDFKLNILIRNCSNHYQNYTVIKHSIDHEGHKCGLSWKQ